MLTEKEKKERLDNIFKKYPKEFIEEVVVDLLCDFSGPIEEKNEIEKMIGKKFKKLEFLAKITATDMNTNIKRTLGFLYLGDDKYLEMIKFPATDMDTGNNLSKIKEDS